MKVHACGDGSGVPLRVKVHDAERKKKLRGRQEGTEEEEEEIDLCQNLETLTWQVGKSCTRKKGKNERKPEQTPAFPLWFLSEPMIFVGFEISIPSLIAVVLAQSIFIPKAETDAILFQDIV